MRSFIISFFIYLSHYNIYYKIFAWQFVLLKFYLSNHHLPGLMLVTSILLSKHLKWKQFILYFSIIILQILDYVFIYVIEFKMPQQIHIKLFLVNKSFHKRFEVYSEFYQVVFGTIIIFQTTSNYLKMLASSPNKNNFMKY